MGKLRTNAPKTQIGTSTSSNSDEEYVSLQKKLAFTLNERARFQLDLGRFQDAIRAFSRTAEVFNSVGDAVNLAVAYCNLAHCFKTMATTSPRAAVAQKYHSYQPKSSLSDDSLTLTQ